MRGRATFSRDEALTIRALLEQKIRSGNLKTFRDKLRLIGFYSGDFKRVSSGFAHEDFDELIKSERMTFNEEGRAG